MAHQQPNTANIPGEFDTEGKVKLLGKEMRSLWRAPKNRLLAGSDAEGIQLRIFAHYIDDAEFTNSLINGKKDDKTDPHSLNQRLLGPACKSRAAAKRFIYALLLGAGIDKLGQILVADKQTTEEALERLISRYEGFALLKKTIIPQDARRGWFIGLDGRKVRIVGNTAGERKHLCMSGYLQNGEAVVVKMSVLKTLSKIKSLPEADKILLTDIVHDEVIFETPNDVTLAEKVNRLFNESIEEVGVELNLKCPLKGDGHVGLNWFEIH
jgi:DNA polymerase-1